VHLAPVAPVSVNPLSRGDYTVLVSLSLSVLLQPCELLNNLKHWKTCKQQFWSVLSRLSFLVRNVSSDTVNISIPDEDQEKTSVKDATCFPLMKNVFKT